MGVSAARLAAPLAAALVLAPLAAWPGAKTDENKTATDETVVVYGAWETKQIEGLVIAQTATPSMSLHVVCPEGQPEAISASLVTDTPVPAYRGLSGPVASFDFDDVERVQFAAVADETAIEADRFFRLEASREKLTELIKKLRRARTVGVVVIGGPSFEQARLARAELSLKGSSKALRALRRGCR